jgi:hypothetical protein
MIIQNSKLGGNGCASVSKTVSWFSAWMCRSFRVSYMEQCDHRPGHKFTVNRMTWEMKDYQTFVSEVNGSSSISWMPHKKEKFRNMIHADAFLNK